MTDAISTLSSFIVVCNRTFLVAPGEFILHDITPRVILASMVLVIFLLGIFGNLLVILAVILSKRLQNITNVFVTNLAVADFVTNLFLPVHAATLLNRNNCYIPDLLCKFVAAVTLTTVGSSIVTLALIAFARFRVIRDVLHPDESVFINIYRLRNVVAMVAFSWLYPILLMIIIIPIGVGSLGYSFQYRVCTQNTENEYSDYLTLTAGLTVQFPAFVVIIVCYVRILVMYRRHEKEFAYFWRPSRKSTRNTEPETNITVVDDYPDGNLQNSSMRQESLTPVEPQISSINTDHDVTNSSDHINATLEQDSQRPSTDVASVSYAHAATDNDPVRDREKVSLPNINTVGSDDVTPRFNNPSKDPQQISIPSESKVTNCTLSKEMKQMRYQQQKKITVNLFIIVCVYTVCIMPAAFAVLVPSSDPAIPWLSILFLCNSCANPIIYALKHPNFSRIFVYVLKCRCSDIPDRSHLLRSPCCY